MPQKIRRHLNPAMMTNVNSSIATVTAAVASSAGATNQHVVDEPVGAGRDRLVEERRQAEPDAQQVEQRVADAADHDGPAVRLHAAQLVLGDVPGAEPARPGRSRDGCLGEGRRHSIRLRPVSRRNTSSRLDRRTSDVVGCSPRSVTRSSTASPSSAYSRTRSGSTSMRSTRPAIRTAADALCSDPNRSSTTSRVEYCADQRRRAALGHDPALVDDHDPVAELLGLVHVVRGEHEGGAALLEPEQPVPQHVPGLRVEAGGRLVEHEDARLVDQRPGDGQPPLHAARQVVDLGVALLLELREPQELVGPRRAHGPGDAEVAAVHDEVVPHAQLGVEVVLLRHHAEQRPDLRAVRVGVEAEHASGLPRCAATPRRPSAWSSTCPHRWARAARTTRRAAPRSRCRRRR